MTHFHGMVTRSSLLVSSSDMMLSGEKIELSGIEKFQSSIETVVGVVVCAELCNDCSVVVSGLNIWSVPHQSSNFNPRFRIITNSKQLFVNLAFELNISHTTQSFQSCAQTS